MFGFFLGIGLRSPSALSRELVPQRAGDPSKLSLLSGPQVPLSVKSPQLNVIILRILTRLDFDGREHFWACKVEGLWRRRLWVARRPHGPLMWYRDHCRKGADLAGLPCPCPPSSGKRLLFDLFLVSASTAIGFGRLGSEVKI